MCIFVGPTTFQIFFWILFIIFSFLAILQHKLLTTTFCSVGRAMELQKQRHPKHLATPSSVSPEPQDSAKLRQSGLTSEGTDVGYLPANSTSSVVSGATLSQEGGKENDMGELVLYFNLTKYQDFKTITLRIEWQLILIKTES